MNNSVQHGVNGGGLKSLLQPESVAIIGASDNPSRIGGRPLRYLREAGFKGAVYPVNPNRAEVQGFKAYPGIEAIEGEVDLALIAIPAEKVVQAVSECIAKGVKAAVIFSSGFAEVSDAGAKMQQQVRALAQASGMRILGPNCLGVFNSAIGFFLTFTATLDRGFPAPGRLAIVSQSGAYGSHVYFLARNKGLSVKYWITTGNECDVHVAECLLWLADDPGTDVIAVYAEGIRDGRLLIKAFERARANRKPIVFMKVGGSEVGAQAAASHTASLAGADAVYDAVFRQFGVHRAHSTEELLDIVYACERGIFPTGRKLGLVTISGGVGVQMADTAEVYGLDVVPMPESAQRELKAALPFAATRNPVDITAQAFNDISLVTRNMELMLDRGGYDVILAFFTSVAGSSYLAPILRDALDAACEQFSDRLMVLSIIASEEIIRDYEARGYLVFEDPSRAIAAISALCYFGASFAQDEQAQAEIEQSGSSVFRLDETPSSVFRLDETPSSVFRLDETPLTEYGAKRLLAEFGLPVVAEKLVQTAAAAAAAATELGYPILLKIVSPDIRHKTEIGGVVLNLADADAVKQAAGEMLSRVKRELPKADITGLLVARQVRGGIETILGIQSDPAFGPVIMFGLGGVFVEVFEDVAFRVAPLSEQDARAMVEETKAAKILRGARGQVPYDIDALVKALVSLSGFALKHAAEIKSIDINPFLLLPEGRGGLALDALIELKDECGE